ncbi:plasmid transfer factor, TraG protein [Komagataeibacter europaeus NBRC 3261]|uniref:Plasmid transfer factor, TraG protein n=1 Tax=Komagataeibacter europaeus NBRC 3261 TaxID=1234669 RepID=A0A0D6Q3C4_KOMEU|nr:plasmid transfer factor, TraG protein [Komagataeibacter europaeus NBRC 3261]
MGAILHVLYAEKDKTLYGVANLLSDPKRSIEATLAAMMQTKHLGKDGPHPVVASAARELLNKSPNERSGVLSTAMSFLGLYRDPVVAKVTSRCAWRIADIVKGRRPTTLYLSVPPSDISRTKPLIRLMLNQIGRRLTEDLNAHKHNHRLLMMLDEFPALGRLDFFESALAFMGGYGIKAFLIAQSLNQIEKAYGQNNSILDNCHVRVSFATNDERTAKRVSDALGTATEIRSQKNYAGHRLSPWLGHLMVSRQESARPLLTPGEIMQLPPTAEIVMAAGTPPVRAKKARYYSDARFRERALPPPQPGTISAPTAIQPDDWTRRPLPETVVHGAAPPLSTQEEETPLGAGHKRTPDADPSDIPPRTERDGDRWTMKRSRKKQQMTVYLDPDLFKAVSDTATRRRQSGSLVVETALSVFFSPEEGTGQAALTRRLDRVDKRLSRLERDTGITVETLAQFIRFWMIMTPALPESSAAAARAQAAERYEGFIEALGRRLATGRRLYEDVLPPDAQVSARLRTH